MLDVIDEFARECIAIRVKRRLNATDIVAGCATRTSYAGPRAPADYELE